MVRWVCAGGAWVFAPGVLSVLVSKLGRSGWAG